MSSNGRLCPECGSQFSGAGRTCSMSCRTAANKKKPLVEKTCAVPNCGKIFRASPMATAAKFCKNDHYRLCDGECGQEKLVAVGVAVLDSWVCASCIAKIRAEKQKLELLEEFGVENISQRPDVKKKREETYRNKFGGNSPFSGAEVREKAKATNLERYGAENGGGSTEAQEKLKETNRERYGVENIFQSPEVKEKIRSSLEQNFGGMGYGSTFAERIRMTMLEKYGTANPMDSELIRSKSLETQKRNANSGVKSNKVSKKNLNLKQTLEAKYSIEVHLEHPVGGKQFDLFLPQHRILIELNPTFSHNTFRSYQCGMRSCDIPCENHVPLSDDYHYKKSLIAMRNNLNLLHIYDWNTAEQILQLLSGKIEPGYKKHSARKLEARKIEQKIANKFLEENHIQGGTKKQTHCYGLYADLGHREGLFPAKTLIAVATFGPSRFKAKEQFEWIRYAVKQGHIIHGGAGKLWREFQRDAEPASVISYVDFDHTTAPTIFLHTVGFEEDKPTGPSKIWSKKEKRIYHNSLLAQGADRLLGTSYGRPEECGLNNEQIMLLEGWLPVYTAGNRVFRWRRAFQS